jgi:tape measure domain-containing protein
VAVSNVEIRVNANNAVAQLNRLNGVAGTTAGTFGRLQSAAAGLGLGLIAKSAVQSAASFKALQTRLKLVTSEFGEFEQAQALVAKAAKQFGISNREAAEGVADIFTRLRPLGISLADIESTFIGFNTVAKLSGVSAAGASAAFTQLAQALGSGRLQGDEFRSIAEQVPGLLQAISSATGIATGDLKEYASQGKLTSDIVVKALKKLESEGADKIAAIVKDSDVQRFKDFQNATDDLSIAIGSSLLPVVTPLIEGATELVKAFGALPEPIQASVIGVTGLAGAAAILSPAIATLNGLLATLTGGAGLKAAITGLAVMGEKAKAAAAGKTALANAITAANVKITASTVAVGLLSAAITAIPIALALVAFGNLAKRLAEAKTAQDRMTEAIKSGNVETIKAAIAVEEETMSIERNKAAKMSILNINGKLEASRKRLAKLRQALEDAKTGGGDGDGGGNGNGNGNNLLDLDGKRKDMSQRMLDLNNQLRAAQEGEQARLAATLALMVRKQEIAESEMLPLERQNALNEAHFQFRQEILGIDQQIADQAAADFQARMKHQDKLREAIAAQKTQYDELNETFRTGIVDSILDAVDGTKSLADGLAGVLKQMGRMILQQQLMNALSGFNIFGGGGGAGGGFGVTPKTSGMKFFANGGRPPVGRPSVVGERGPELFVPSRAGTIIPNNQLGGNTSVVVNVDASGTEVQGNQGNADQLGRLIGQAVQAELIKQKRPGGLLTR